MQQDPEDYKNNQVTQPKQQQSKRGKPKGMNGQPKLQKSGAWSSNQQSTQIIQTLTRTGRFVNFQQTGKKTKQPVSNNNQENGIFLSNEQLNIVKAVADICQISQKGNKNCFVFFFATEYPEFVIEDGIPKLLNNYEEYSEFDSLHLIAPLITKKFLEELVFYLKVVVNIKFKDLFQRQVNKNLQTADTILQANFAKFLIEPKQMLRFQEKNQVQEQLFNFYQEYINQDVCSKDYENSILELLGCMQQDDSTDQYDQQ